MYVLVNFKCEPILNLCILKCKKKKKNSIFGFTWSNGILSFKREKERVINHTVFAS